jgi:hypothetical protein
LPHLAIIGEYNYLSMPQYEGVNFHILNYGGGVRANLISRGRIIPFVVGTGGGARFTGSEGSQSVSADGDYGGGGGGVSVYVGRNWGIRPEIRYNHYSFTYQGESATTNGVTTTVAIFFQLGGNSAPSRR